MKYTRKEILRKSFTTSAYILLSGKWKEWNDSYMKKSMLEEI